MEMRFIRFVNGSVYREVVRTVRFNSYKTYTRVYIKPAYKHLNYLDSDIWDIEYLDIDEVQFKLLSS